MSKPVDLLFPDAKVKREAGLCPTCNNKVGDFRNAISQKEFSISGMCQACQDSVFGED